MALLLPVLHHHSISVRTISTPSPCGPGAHAQQGDQSDIHPLPDETLLTQAKLRLDEGRIRDEGGEGTQIARRIEEVGVGRRVVSGRGEPALHHRRPRCQQHEGKPQRHRQQPQQPHDRSSRASRWRAHVARHGQRKKEQRGREHGHVEPRLRCRTQPSRRRVGIEIAHQERPLKEEKARIPHRWRAAQQGQHHLGEHGLDRE